MKKKKLSEEPMRTLEHMLDEQTIIMFEGKSILRETRAWSEIHKIMKEIKRRERGE